MTHINKLVLLPLLLFVSICFGQQESNFTMLKYNMSILNPAFAGINDGYELDFSFRDQWVGLDNAPIIRTMSFSTPFSKNVGLGLSVIHNKIFITKETDIVANFSYKLRLNRSMNLFLGLRAGGTIMNVNFTSLNLLSDPSFAQNQNRFIYIIGAGALLRNEDYFVAISVPNLLTDQREGIEQPSSSDKLHFYLSGGYILEVNENFKIKPVAIFRYVEDAISRWTEELSLSVDIYNKVEPGISYRIDENYGFTVLIKMIKSVEFGYAFEKSLTDVKTLSNGTHEGLIRFRF